jgi:spore coat polysaccharide biosynthesis protein SpsF
MGSTRLPGKVMKKIIGKPLLELLIERLQHCHYLDEIIIATTTNVADEPIKNLAERLSIKYMRGSEEDVLDRYYQAAKGFNIDHIVRITADCPLIDPEVVDRVIISYLNNNLRYDYVSNTLKPTFPDGLDVEVFSLNVLEKIHKVSDKKYQREHVCGYIIENPDQFIIKNVTNDKDLSKLRWTVDNPEDYELIKIIFENLYQKKKIFFMEDILRFLSQNPDLLLINSNIERNEGFLRSLAKEELNDAEKKKIIEIVIGKKRINEA